MSLTINAPSKYLPTYGYTKDYAQPHIEIDNLDFFHYVIIERGQELERKTTDKIEVLLKWIFIDVTFEMASVFASNNSKPNIDYRRILFQSQEKLLKFLSTSWQVEQSIVHEQIIKKYDFLITIHGREAYLNASLNREEGYPERGLGHHFQEYRRQIGETFILHPNQTILATSLEYLKLPTDVILMLVLCSSYARLGLTISTVIQLTTLNNIWKGKKATFFSNYI